MLGTTIDPAQGAPRAPHLAALTGLRFMAAANVLAFHYAPHPSFIDLGNIPMLVYLTVLSGGASSVSLFFVLSGFVLAHRYIGDDGTFRGQRARFWLARVRRIAPAYFLAYVLALSWMALHGGTDPLAALATLGMVQAWWAPLARIVNNPAWSLSVEVFFYATFPLLAPPVYRWAQKRPAAVVAALLLVCCLVRISGTLPGPLVRDGALAPWFALLILRLAHGRGLVARVLALPRWSCWVRPATRCTSSRTQCGTGLGRCWSRLVEPISLTRGWASACSYCYLWRRR